MLPLPYPTYKSSGVEWLGDVPAHWGVLPNRAILSEVNDRGHAQEQMLAVTISKGVIPQRELLEDSSKKDSSRLDRSSYKLVQQGDIAYNKMRAWQGALGVSHYQGIVSPAYVVQRPRINALPRYLHYLLRTPAFANEAVRWSYGITSDMWSLRPEHFKVIYACVPPIPEQTTIARFLDHATNQIKRYIRAKERLIALLEEQNRVMIHEAVTGRIDVRTGKPYPACKPSGVEYLGEIPNEWNALSLRRVTIDRCDGPFGSGLKSSHYTDKGIRVIRLQNIRHGEFDASDAAYISADHYATLGDHSVEENDVLIAGLGDSRHPAGRACVAPASILPAMVKADCFRFRLKRDEVEPKFLAFQLSATASAAAGLLSTGATRQRVSLQSTSSRVVGIPPLHDQVRITSFIIAKSQHIHTAQKAARKEISLIREYRTRLIANVVTGKLDVREAAANLPELEAIAEGDNEKIPAECNSQQSNTTLHNEVPQTTPGASS